MEKTWLDACKTKLLSVLYKTVYLCMYSLLIANSKYVKKRELYQYSFVLMKQTAEANKLISLMYM